MDNEKEGEIHLQFINYHIMYNIVNLVRYYDYSN